MVKRRVWTMGKPRHLDGDVDNLEGELQLWNVIKAPVVAHIRPHNREVNELGNHYGFQSRTIGISHCVKTGMSTTFEEQLQTAELPHSLHCLDHGTCRNDNNLVQELHQWRIHGLADKRREHSAKASSTTRAATSIPTMMPKTGVCRQSKGT